jgi:hypothetical protein
MAKLLVASSRQSGESGTESSDHVLFYDDGQGAVHVFERRIERGARHPRHCFSCRTTELAYGPSMNWQAPVEARFKPGEYMPRIWRGHEHPPSQVVGLYDAEISTRRVVLNLCERLEAAFWHIEPHPACRNAFSHDLRGLLLAACTEVESSWKSILAAHQYKPARCTTNDYIKLAEPLHLAEWTVSLAQHPGWGPIAPFASWSTTGPTGSIPWYKAYNETKHDRESHLDQATLGHAVDAVAAAYILMLAQFGWSITTEDIFQIPMERTPQLFVLTRAPSWTAAEEYMAPDVKVGEHQLGYKEWTPIVLPL